MNGFTICRECDHRVHTAPGFCSVCGAVFTKIVILRQVAAREDDGGVRSPYWHGLHPYVRLDPKPYPWESSEDLRSDAA